MCGIWGFVSRTETVSVTDAWKGLESIRDRGPDDWGVYTDPGGKYTERIELPVGDVEVFLGNRRLSILDLSKAGNQPFAATDRGLWLIYNGEVYNYEELRAELQDHGYSFSSDCDTEVVLRAYQEFGPDCVKRFRGMFAFSIWDEREERLFAARDRLGIKPFYYHASGSHLSFASEVTALIQSGVVSPDLDPVGVDGFLAFGSVPSPHTIIDGVRSLPPGATLTYEARTNETTVNRYRPLEFGGSERPSPREVRETLRESVRLRLRSDVPVGAFLSGGLDSSIIVGLMSQLRAETPGADDPIHTFSITFDESSYSEESHAATVADAFGTNHSTKTVTASDVREHLDEFVDSMDQPTIDGMNTFFVSKLAAEADLRVALSGLGSDELFYGYHTFDLVPTATSLANLLQATPKNGRNTAGRLLGAIDDYISPLPLSELSDVIQADAPFGAAYVAVRGVFPSEKRQDLLEGFDSVDDFSGLVEADVRETLRASDVEDAVSHAELRWYMHNQLLRDTDVMSMCHSLEVRVPFLDSKVVDNATSTAPELKSNGPREKYLLKQSAADFLPESVLDRDKTGFTFPFAEWLDDELRPEVDAALAPEMITQTPLDYRQVRRVRTAFRNGEVHWSRLWALVVLSLWIDRHVR